MHVNKIFQELSYLFTSIWCNALIKCLIKRRRNLWFLSNKSFHCSFLRLNQFIYPLFLLTLLITRWIFLEDMANNRNNKINRCIWN